MIVKKHGRGCPLNMPDGTQEAQAIVIHPDLNVNTLTMETPLVFKTQIAFTMSDMIEMT